MSTRKQNKVLAAENKTPSFPSTRYQGSKVKLVPWLKECLKDLDFDTALDAFGGTGSVAYMLKQMGKAVTYNDILKFNAVMADAIIGNASERLDDNETDQLLRIHEARKYQDVVQRNFQGIFYTDDENAWIDRVVQNIPSLPTEARQAIAFAALFQACLIKRPFNLFHRKNLYLRLNDVPRGFGNKATWDRPFRDHFLKFIREMNGAVFDNDRANRVLNTEALEIDGPFDLVYMDPPYLRDTGVGVDYLEFYHFLEGLTKYEIWESRIDTTSKHRRILHEKPIWCDPARVTDAYKRFFDRYHESIIAVSTRSDGLPTVPEIKSLLSGHGKKVTIHEYGKYTYALSTNRASKEILILGT
ncbi:DNA adenine methylase [Acidobacteriota bacterium]